MDHSRPLFITVDSIRVIWSFYRLLDSNRGLYQLSHNHCTKWKNVFQLILDVHFDEDWTGLFKGKPTRSSKTSKYPWAFDKLDRSDNANICGQSIFQIYLSTWALDKLDRSDNANICGQSSFQIYLSTQGVFDKLDMQITQDMWSTQISDLLVS